MTPTEVLIPPPKKRNPVSALIRFIVRRRSDPVGERLRQISFRQRLFNVLALMLGSVCALLLYVVLAICADRLWEFASATRQMLLIASAGLGSLALAILAVVVLFRRVNPLVYARAVDQALGRDDDVMVTCMELKRRGELAGGDAEIAGLLQDQALERLRAVDVDQIVSAKLLTGFSWTFGALTVVLLCMYLLFGRTFSDSLFRVIMPWRHIAPPRAVVIAEVHPGNGVAASGEPVRFWIKTRGERLPETATLSYRVEGEAGFREEVLNKTTGGKYEKELPGFSRAVSYSLRCGDAEKGPFHLMIVERPLVTSVHVRVHPPAYAPLAAVREIAGGHVQAITGSRIEIAATVNKTPAREEGHLKAGDIAWLQAGNVRTPMAVDGATLKATLPVQNDFDYQIAYVDLNGIHSRESVQYKVRAIADQAPKVFLQRDGADAAVNRTDTVVFQQSAADDLGVARLTLKVAREGSLDRAVEINCSPATPRTLIEGPLALDLRRVAPNDGDVLLCSLIAEDVKVPAQRAESGVVRVVIAKPEERKPETKPEIRIEKRPEAKDEAQEFVVRKRGEKDPPPAEAVKPDLNSVLKLDEKQQQPPEPPAESPPQEQPPPQEAAQPDVGDIAKKEQELLEELAKLLKEQIASNEEKMEKLEELAQQQQQLVDQLSEMIEKQEQQGTGDRGQGSEPNQGDAQKPEPGAGPRSEQEQKAEQEQKSEQGKKPGEGKGQEPGKGEGQEPGQGEQPGQGKGEQPGEGEGNESGKGEGKQPGQGEGKEPGQGEGKQPGQGEGKQPGKGEGQKPGQGEGQGESGKKPGQGNGQGQGGDGKSESESGEKSGDGAGKQPGGGGKSDKPGKGQGQSDGPNGGKDDAQAGNNTGGDSSSQSPNGGGGKSNAGDKQSTSQSPAGNSDMKSSRDAMADAARQMRSGKVDDATLKRARNALDQLFKAGRAFSAQDKAALKELSERIAKNTKTDAKPRDPKREDDHLGRSRSELTQGKGPDSKTIKNRAGELKEDDLRRGLDSRKSEIAPEYRKPLEEYYKAVSQ